MTTFGNTRFLKPSHIHALHRLSTTQMGNQLVSVQAARQLCALAYSCGRTIGLLVDRRGSAISSIVGEPERLYLPDIGRARVSARRLRGIRLIVAKPKRANRRKQANGVYSIQSDLIGDLAKLRLDAAVQIEAVHQGPARAAAAVLHFGDKQKIPLAPRTWHVANVHELVVDIAPLLEEAGETLKHHHKSHPLSQLGKKRGTALLVGIYTQPRHIWQPRLHELRELARSAQVDIAATMVQQRQQLDARTLVGRGKLEEITLRALYLGANLLIFDRDLSPAQFSGICERTNLKVLDRSMLILDIFARRATTADGRLQVELAQLRYCLPRLGRRQSGLSRLTGGIGGQGPGETKLEIDRRRVQARITRAKQQLKELVRRRRLTRRQRRGRLMDTIALVGYTNAGKSTLLNALTQSTVHTQDQLFATLDPTARRCRLPQNREVIFTDTVGFIRDLPPGLLDAFKATLEELHEANLLLHTVDANSPACRRHIQAVEKILTQLDLANKPRLLVLNKIDMLDQSAKAELQTNYPGAVKVSARGREGLADLVRRCAAQLGF